MSKKKKAICVNCGKPIKRHEERLELRVGDSPVVARTAVKHVSQWLPKSIFDSVLKVFKWNPDRIQYNRMAEYDLRPIIYTHLGGKCPGNPVRQPSYTLKGALYGLASFHTLACRASSRRQSYPYEIAKAQPQARWWYVGIPHGR